MPRVIVIVELGMQIEPEIRSMKRATKWQRQSKLVRIAVAEPFNRCAGVLPSPRHVELWRGVGLALCNVSGVDTASLVYLRKASINCLQHLAQGGAFAAKARERAGTPARHSDLACRILCGLAASEAAAITDDALVDLPLNGKEEAFEIWRRRIRDTLARSAVQSATSP